MNVKAKYKLPTGQFAIQSWDVGSDWPDDVIRQMAEAYPLCIHATQPEWELVAVIKFPDGVNQEWVYKGENNE